MKKPIHVIKLRDDIWGSIAARAEALGYPEADLGKGALVNLIIDAALSKINDITLDNLCETARLKLIRSGHYDKKQAKFETQKPLVWEYLEDE
jgi:hypothetical protein